MTNSSFKQGFIIPLEGREGKGREGKGRGTLARHA
jgi:hypothetical protein